MMSASQDAHLGDRLRRALASVDRVAVLDGDDLTTAIGRAERRLRRRRTSVRAAAVVAAVGLGTIAWSVRHAPIEQAATPPPSTAPAESSADSAWAAISANPNGPRQHPWVVWTGTEALVVGGTDTDGAPLPGAAAYDPASDVWRMLAAPDDVTDRLDPLVAWTGAEMLVIGGDNPDGSLRVSDGAAYAPSADEWRVIASPPIGFVSARSPWVWTGAELLVWPWDGGGSTTKIMPVAYDPANDTWRQLAEPPVARRHRAASAWTGSEWIVWGGADEATTFSDGVAYDPSTDTWRTLSASPLSARKAMAVWTGNEVIIDAGSSGGDLRTGDGETAHADGAAYDPATDTWRTITPGFAHPGFVPVWTGDRLVMFAKGSAVVYDPATDTWLDTCCVETGGSTWAGTPVWTGSTVLVMGSAADDHDHGGSTFTPR